MASSKARQGIRSANVPRGDERVGGVLNSPLTGEWPDFRLDAIDFKVRQCGRIGSVAAMIAFASSPTNTEARREIIGMGIGPSKAFGRWSSPFRTGFLRSVKVGSGW